MRSKAALKDLLSITKDGEWGKGEPADGLTEMAVIRGTDFAGVRLGGLQNVPTRYIPEKIAARKRLQPDDILIETAGGSKDRPTGRSVYLKDRIFELAERPLTCASFSRFLRVNKALAHPEFVYWYLQHLYMSGQMEAHQVQHTGIARFQYTKFAETTTIPLPTREEQRAIASVLGSLDDKIELNRRMNETLEEMARALFKSWFVDFDPVRAKMEGREPFGMDDEAASLFPDSFKESTLGEIPKGWRADSFSEMIELTGGGTPKTSVDEYWNGEIPWFSVVDAPRDSDAFVISTEKQITEAGVTNSSTKILPVGTTIISARGTVGKCALVGVPMAMNQSCYGLRGREGQGEYFTYFATRRMVIELQQHAHGSVFSTITRNTFRGITVPIPPPDLTRIYDKAVRAYMQLILANLHESWTLAAIRGALLPKLVSGEIRVAEAEEMVEDAV